MGAGEHFIKKAYQAIFQQDFEQAIDHFKKAIAVEPANASFYYRLSITYARSNKLMEAIEQAEKALSLDEENVSFKYYLDALYSRYLSQQAFSFIKNGENLEQTIEFFNRAISLNPLNVEAYILLAVALQKSGQKKDAEQVILKALRLDPHHQDLRQLLSQLLS